MCGAAAHSAQQYGTHSTQHTPHHMTHNSTAKHTERQTTNTPTSCMRPSTLASCKLALESVDANSLRTWCSCSRWSLTMSPFLFCFVVGLVGFGGNRCCVCARAPHKKGARRRRRRTALAPTLPPPPHAYTILSYQVLAQRGVQDHLLLGAVLRQLAHDRPRDDALGLFFCLL